jgi:hypothetical protein
LEGLTLVLHADAQECVNIQGDTLLYIKSKTVQSIERERLIQGLKQAYCCFNAQIDGRSHKH